MCTAFLWYSWMYDVVGVLVCGEGYKSAELCIWGNIVIHTLPFSVICNYVLDVGIILMW